MSASILVLEDSDDFRDLLRMTLEFAGYDVTLARNGHEGLDAARTMPNVAIILSDIDMPEMNGLDFVRAYRAEFGTKTPIIMLSGERAETLKAAIAAGATNSIAKPFEPIQLLDLISRTLQ